MDFVKLNSNATVPTRATEGSAGFDVYASENATIPQGETVLVSTGLAFSIPVGYTGLLFPRSGLAVKQGLNLANCVGVIDSDYRGELKVALHNISKEAREVAAGERIAQLVLVPHITPTLNEVEELGDTVRGEGGFGSTGR